MAAVVAAVRAEGGGEGLPDPLFELVLCRRYCRPAGESRLRDAAAKEWDTVKPLALHFEGGPAALARVALVDNDAHKAVHGEDANMVLVPTWGAGAGAGDAGDRVLPALVDALLCGERGLVGSADVRDRTAFVSAAAAAAAAAVATTTAPSADDAVIVLSDDEDAGAAAAGARPAAPPSDAVPTTTTASAPPPIPSPPLSKKAARRAAQAAAIAAAGVAGAGALVAASAPAAPPPAADAVRSAWKTAVVQAVAELTDLAAVDINHVYAYVRYRATGDAKLHLTKARLRDAVRTAAGKRGALVALKRGTPLRAASPKLVARCFKLAPGATAPPTDVALASLADALGGGKRGGGGGEGGSKAGVEGAVAGVTLASVRDMTVGHGPSMALVLRHLSDRYGKPVEVLGTRGAAARNTLQRELEEELRIEMHSFGAGTPVALQGLRCLVRPTGEECAAAAAVLLAAKKEAEKPRAVIAGTLANLLPATPESAIVLTSGTGSPSSEGDDDDLTLNFDTPLPVFEDRGGPEATQAASQGVAEAVGADQGATQPAAAPAPQAVADPPPTTAPPVPFAAPVPPPRAVMGGGGAHSSLHHEILAFAHAAIPSARDVAAVRAAVEAVGRTASRLWPDSRTVLFGSQATGLALPGSDLDIVVLGASDELANPATGFSWDQRHILGTRLKTLLKALRKGGLVAGKAIVIKARVPIIKCQLTMGVAADISLGAVNGAAAVQYIQAQSAALPPLRPLSLIVKAVLKEAGLNEVFSGGLSSYCTTLMVMAHLLATGPSVVAPSADWGALLHSFFQRYGREFDYESGAVCVSRGGFARKLADWVKPDRPGALAVEDPQESGKDIGSGSFNIDAVRDLFSRAADALAGAARPAPPARGAGRRGAPPPSTWAAVQADGASRSVPPPPPAGRLAAVMDVDAALGRRRAGGGPPSRAVARRPPGGGDRGTAGGRRPAPGHPHAAAPAHTPSAKAPAARRGKFARVRAKAAGGERAPPSSVHRPMGAPPREWGGGGGGGGGRPGSTKKKRGGRRVEWA